jgi:ABC-type bacteriocin/lantibiotic exporter with double-glycine peptidase domain
MPQLAFLRLIFKKHRLQLLVTYVLFSLEMLGALLTPYFLGEAVNELIHASYKGLILLCLVRFLWMIIAVIRQRYDTRTYSAIYSSIVTRFLSKVYAKKDVSKLSAHSTLAREFVDFLEHDIVYVFEAFYNIVGSLVLLSFYNGRVVGICLMILVPVMAISYYYGKQMKKLNRQKNDELELQVDIIDSGNILAIRRHYQKLMHWQIKISDKQAINFGIMEILSIIVIAISLLITQRFGAAVLSAGSIIGIYSYIKNFVTGLDTIPYAVDKFSSLSDIIRRINMEESDFDDEAQPTTKILEPTLATVV